MIINSTSEIASIFDIHLWQPPILQRARYACLLHKSLTSRLICSSFRIGRRKQGKSYA